LGKTSPFASAFASDLAFSHGLSFRTQAHDDPWGAGQNRSPLRLTSRCFPFDFKQRSKIFEKIPWVENFGSAFRMS